MVRFARMLLVTTLLGAASLGGTAIGLLDTPAQAADKKGRPVTIHVVDEYGVPIPNARVRVPGTEGKTLVNRNGDWTESMLYTIMGDEFVFEKNAFVEFHVSAPEFHARSVKYKVRGRMNYVEVALRKMPEPTRPLEDKDDRDLLIRWFQRTEVEDDPSASSEAAAPDSEGPGEAPSTGSEGG